MSASEDVIEWLKKAEEELETALVNYKNERFEAAAFFAHQAAEKALKALYIFNYRRLWKIHDLQLLAEKVKAPKTVITKCAKLNPHYIATRYPSGISYSDKIALRAIEDAEKVVEWVKKKLKKLLR